LPILTKKMCKFLKSKNKTGYPKNQYYGRIENYTALGIEDLTTILKTLPEDRLKKIFNSVTLKPFFEALFYMESQFLQIGKDEKGGREPGMYLIKHGGEEIKLNNESELKDKQKRLLELSQLVIECIGFNARKISPEIYSLLLESKQDGDIMLGIKTISLTPKYRVETKK